MKEIKDQKEIDDFMEMIAYGCDGYIENIIIYPLAFTIDISLNVSDKTKRIPASLGFKYKALVLNLQFRDITIFKFERGKEDDYEEVEQGFRLKIIDGIFHLTLTVPPHLNHPYGIETTKDFIDKKFYVLSKKCFYEFHDNSSCRLEKSFYTGSKNKREYILNNYSKGIYSKRYLSRSSKAEKDEIKEVIRSEYGEVEDLD